MLILITTLFAKNLKIVWIYISMQSILYFMTVFYIEKKYLWIGLLFIIPFITSIYLLPNIVTLSLNQNEIKGQEFHPLVKNQLKIILQLIIMWLS